MKKVSSRYMWMNVCFYQKGYVFVNFVVRWCGFVTRMTCESYMTAGVSCGDHGWYWSAFTIHCIKTVTITAIITWNVCVRFLWTFLLTMFIFFSHSLKLNHSSWKSFINYSFEFTFWNCSCSWVFGILKPFCTE